LLPLRPLPSPRDEKVGAMVHVNFSTDFYVRLPRCIVRYMRKTIDDSHGRGHPWWR
jgi:hypothetical protein